MMPSPPVTDITITRPKPLMTRFRSLLAILLLLPNLVVAQQALATDGLPAALVVSPVSLFVDMTNLHLSGTGTRLNAPPLRGPTLPTVTS